MLYAREDLEAAEPVFRESLELYRKSLGERHPRVATVMTNVAVLLDTTRQRLVRSPTWQPRHHSSRTIRQ